MNQLYIDTARLMVQVAPFALSGESLALKGGTAINLFLRDMPRLSVDLDLAFTDHRLKRREALSEIAKAIRECAERLQKRRFETRIVGTRDDIEARLLVRRGTIEVKIEINYNIRGSVNPVSRASLTQRAKDVLLADLEIPILSSEDIYGGKLVAALDRQHPRDLFDVMQLFENEGITPGIRRSFVVYLASHNRPIHEVLFPTQLDISRDFDSTFRGMTSDPVALGTLLAARGRLMDELPKSLSAEERHFLVSLANAQPQWHLLAVPHIQELPAIRWKLQNLKTLAVQDDAKLRKQADELAQRFAAL